MTTTINSTRRSIILGGAALASGLLPLQAHAAEPFRIGAIYPLSGPFASTGAQSEAAIRLYMKKFGNAVAGRKIELILKDDGGASPDVTKRIAQELVTRDKVHALLGFGLTPLAMATAPIATQAKIPMVVTVAAASAVMQRSPYIVRTACAQAQITAPMALWALKNNIKSVITLVSDYGPGIDGEKVFVKHFEAGGGNIKDTLRVPLRNPDYAPFLQRVRNAKPDAVFVFVPAGEGAALMKQFTERGLKDAGIRLIGTGDVLDDDLMKSIGAASDGVITTHQYSAAHDSASNRDYVAAIARDNKGMRANMHSVAAYDGMHLLYEALRKTNGDSNGDKLLAAMKGMSWDSVRGPISIDPDTRDIIQNIYTRKAELRHGEYWNIEFETLANYKDPGL